jgi:penicillin-binding protein 1C
MSLSRAMSRAFLALAGRRRFLALMAACGTAVWLRCAPLPAGLLDARHASSTLVVDRQGEALYEALGSGGVRGVAMTAESIPPVLAAATVAAEDHRYWSHPGVDPIAIARAGWRNLRGRRVVEGGSTLSQQTAKLLLSRQHPDRRRGLRAKLQEAVIALRLEHRFDKREILAIYLSLASYGNQIVGAERASRAYFARTADMLTPAQAAFLAGLPQRPSTFNPFKRVDLATRRQRSVLNRMAAARFLTEAQAAEARAERLSFSAGDTAFLAPHFVEMVLARTGRHRPERIETTLDAPLQREVAGIIRAHRADLDRHGAGNVAVVVLDNRRGEWLAWEGSGAWLDAERDGSINGPVTPRQPGSTLKPFTYALAFEGGYTPATVLADVPAHFPTPDSGILYSPRNYDGRYRGPMLARRALAGSENVPAVAVASELGVPALLRFLTHAGLTTFDKGASHYGLGLTLGNAEVRLDELTAAYAAFARGGEWIEPTFVRRVSEPRTQRVVSTRTAFWISDVLSDSDARAFIFGRGGSLELPFPVAVKTGTSQAYHDNWTIGYTHDVTVGVWVGNFDRKPLRNSSGVTGAAPIFHDVMLAVQARLRGSSDAFTAPGDAGLESRDICALSGMTPNAWCPSRRREWLPASSRSLTEPPVPCSWHHLTDEGLEVIWPPAFRQWAQQQRLVEGSTAALSGRPLKVAARAASAVPLEISSPPSGATYLIDPTLRREFQTLALRVTTDHLTDIVWSINGRRLGTATSEGALAWPLAPGTHEITARDSRGNSSQASITVR